MLNQGVLDVMEQFAFFICLFETNYFPLALSSFGRILRQTTNVGWHGAGCGEWTGVGWRQDGEWEMWQTLQFASIPHIKRITSSISFEVVINHCKWTFYIKYIHINSEPYWEGLQISNCARWVCRSDKVSQKQNRE